MSTAQAKPELAGVRVRKRKKDLKSKYEPEEFCEALLEEIKEGEGNLDQIQKKLEAAVDTLEYKRYPEPLFDVLFTGGMLDAGGSHEDEVELSPFSILSSEGTHQAIKKHVDVIVALIKRFRYLQKGFEDSISKMLRLLNRFSPEESEKLAIAFTFFFASQTAPMSLLSVLFLDHLVKDSHSLDFVTIVFKTYLKDHTVDQLSMNLRKNGLDDKLLEFFPVSKRTEEVLSRHFSSQGLPEIVTLFEKKNLSMLKNELKEAIRKSIAEESPFEEVAGILKQGKDKVPEVEMIYLVWEALMTSIEWSRRVEQTEDQALTAVNEWGKLFQIIAVNAKTQLSLLLCLQSNCYEDSRLTKIFVKFVILFYKLDVLPEAAILFWFQKGSSSKGKAVFLQQIHPFIKWLNETEEEEDDN